MLQGVGRPTDTSLFKALLKFSCDLLILSKIASEKLGDGFGCEIVAGRSKPAGADYTIAQSLRLAKRP